MTYILALDQGTSSTRSIVFDKPGNIVSVSQQELPQIYPQAGWVEHDAREIWRAQLATARDAIGKAGLSASDIHAAGITNQRETTLVWRRDTGEPIHNAIVWQDRRAEDTCAQLREAGHESLILEKTGLRIDAYFSATKLKWILDHVDGARELARKGELAFGTIDSWLIWQLTRGQRHVTDVSNASRTMLFNVRENSWDPDLMALLDIDPSLMPQVLPSGAEFGAIETDLLGHPIPICGVAGDQQSALFGQACFHGGMAKNTYGTGCFMLMHTGESFQTSRNGLVTTSAAQVDARKEYAMEGSVFVAGAVVQWLRDGMEAFEKSSQIEALARSVPDAGDVMLVPAFTGLGAPYWKAEVRGIITGLTRGTTMAHVARAALDSIAYQSAALLQAMSRDAVEAGGKPLTELRVDGGACVNDLLMQFQADLLGIPVLRPTMVETTALGAAYLAGLTSGVYKDKEELSSLWQVERRFEPQMPRAQADALMARWEHAVRQACAE
ncbi:glycerol kinase [Allopusillimonas soli]|uniref:Glycerol kinase n=1 Tax=Allopusillimonas soli TaxID=659016 RepID=A0A853F629_9BURK|nr:glycerol kinase GlpK [Allopusillimonas soli]NYT35553.1 glycerol kinase GlpK [Allopusillimonas soli]TEA75956.1 glycerol kinase [Allopusillimonas soli]